MAKTRSQSITKLSIKKEEESKEEIKHAQLLNGISNTTKTKSKITKKKTPTINNNNSLSVCEIKLEEQEDAKPLLQKPKRKKFKFITQEQINQFIRYIGNDKMPINAASKKANIVLSTGYTYFNIYKNDPERKVPVPLISTMRIGKRYTQEQRNAFIQYVENDKLSVADASKRVNISNKAGRRYYNIYINNPERKISKPLHETMGISKHCTQEQIKSLIDYVVNKNMSIPEASKELNISQTTARKYYARFMEDPEKKIPEHFNRATISHKPCTQEQIEKLIHLIVENKMSVMQAARNSNMHGTTGYRYYKKYLEDPERKIPKASGITSFAREKIKRLIGYIKTDKMSMMSATRKLNISDTTGYKYYNLYKDDLELKISEASNLALLPRKGCTQDQVNTFVDSIVKDNLTPAEAARKVNISERIGNKYYKKYIIDPERKIPTTKY